MAEWMTRIDERLRPFKRRYYQDLLLRGGLISAAVLVSYFLIATVGEHLLWLSSAVRFLLLVVFLLLAGGCFWYLLREPVRWFLLGRGMDNNMAAKKIGHSVRSVDDQLLNMLQLAGHHDNALAEAGIMQKFSAMSGIRFEQAIDLRLNRKYFPYALAPVAMVILALIFNSSILTGSTARIVQFDKAFSPEAPFRFNIVNSDLRAFRGEDFVLSVSLDGDQVPDVLYVEHNGLLHQMAGGGSGAFSYTFEKIQDTATIRLYAAGFYSGSHTIDVLLRPELISIQTRLNFPRYLGMSPQTLGNSGNLEVPEGTRIDWTLHASGAEKALITFGDGVQNQMKSIENQSFTFGKNFFNNDGYGIVLVNDHAESRDRMDYRVTVIKDALPQIQVRQARDSVLFKSIYIGGEISDDHGLTSLQLNWQVVRKGRSEKTFSSTPVTINTSLQSQEFMVPWRLDSLNLQPDDRLQYFLEVRDNDGVNGSKSTRTAMFEFNVPGMAELKEQLRKQERETSQEMSENVEKAKSLNESIEEAQRKLRGKQMLDWQDKAMIEEILRQKQEMEKALETMQKENEQLNEQRKAFDEQDERIREKTEQLQKLMEEVLDEETKKLFQELEKLLKENAGADQMQKMLDKIRRNEINVEKELDRIRELFNQLKLEARIDESINRLDQTIKDQESLMQKTAEQEKQKGQDDPAGLAEEQEDIRKDLEEEKNSMEEIRELQKEAGEDDKDLPGDEEFDKAGQEMKESQESLKKGDEKKSGEAQKKAVQQMKQMKNNLQNMQQSMEMEMDEQNLESLRQILHGMLKLSFDQEQTMKDFQSVNTSDPAYLTLGQHQLKLQDDAKVLEDSLLALGKKDPFMGSIVIREIGELNHHLDRSSENIRERRRQIAASEMQLSMTSMNNLALMLNDHFQQMMEMMSKGGKGKSKKKSGKPSLSEMQKQLNQQIEQVKQGGKSGKELSEELARMAAEQERIRKALQNLQEKLQDQNGPGQKPGGDLPGKMEQTELDLVNKRITEQTIRRQKEILTRLLEAEKSMREKEFDEERKGEAAKDYEKQVPKAFEEYLKAKEREVEMLKTVPPKLYPYYKKEVNEYFQRIGQQKQGSN